MFNMTALSLFVELLTLKYRKLIGIDLQRDCTNRRELARQLADGLSASVASWGSISADGAKTNDLATLCHTVLCNITLYIVIR